MKKIKLKRKYRELLFIAGVLSGCVLAVVLLIFAIVKIRGSHRRNDAVSVSVSDIDPAMTLVSSVGQPDAPAETEQILESEPEAVFDEATDADIKERLGKMDGLLPEHSTGYILVGDSRFVHMDQVCRISDIDNLFVVAKVGEGYSWFSDTAMSQIKRIISSGLFDKWKIVICLGVNDLDSVEKYIKKYEELKDNYDISLISVNPITSYGSLSNEKIENFNSKLKTIDLPYIDTYNLLKLNGYKTTDGLHYDAATSDVIFKGILMGLEDENPKALTKESGSFLDKSSAAKKKSLQKEILEANKYVRKESTVSGTIIPALSANTTVPASDQGTGNTGNTGDTAVNGAGTAQTPEEPAQKEWTQEELDALYGKSHDDEEDEDDDEEEHHHHDDDDDDDDDDD